MSAPTPDPKTEPEKPSVSMEDLIDAVRQLASMVQQGGSRIEALEKKVTAPPPEPKPEPNPPSAELTPADEEVVEAAVSRVSAQLSPLLAQMKELQGQMQEVSLRGEVTAFGDQDELVAFAPEIEAVKTRYPDLSLAEALTLAKVKAPGKVADREKAAEEAKAAEDKEAEEAVLEDFSGLMQTSGRAPKDPTMDSTQAFNSAYDKHIAGTPAERVLSGTE